MCCLFFYPRLALVKTGACVTVVTIAGVDLLQGDGAGSHKLGARQGCKDGREAFPHKKKKEKSEAKRRRRGGGGDKDKKRKETVTKMKAKCRETS